MWLSVGSSKKFHSKISLKSLKYKLVKKVKTFDYN